MERHAKILVLFLVLVSVAFICIKASNEKPNDRISAEEKIEFVTKKS